MPEMTPLEARLTQENEALRKDNEALRKENKLLSEKIDLLVRRVFGPSSEKLDTDQLLLALEGDEAKKPDASSGDALAALEAESTAPVKPARRRKKRGGITDELLDSLPSVEVYIDPEEVLAEPEAWRRIDEQVTRQLDYEPGRYLCRRIIRRRYARRDEPHRPPVIAELPTMLERSKAGPVLLASILTAKYCDHLPLYRQEQIAKWRHGIDLKRQDMSRWVGLAAEWLRPIYQIILGGMWSDGYAQTDETVIKYLVPGSGRAQHGYFWAIKRPGGDAAFHWATRARRRCWRRSSPVDFSGIIQCDGYSAYPAFAKTAWAADHAGGVLVARAARVRGRQPDRYAPGRCLLIVGSSAISTPSRQRLRARRASAKLRLLTRLPRAGPIMERIGRSCVHWKKSRRHLPQSQMGKAIDYTLTVWDGLSLCSSTDGRVEIDNNEVENAIRPTAVGKKNWLFIGDAEAGERSAIVFTVIEACRAGGSTRSTTCAMCSPGCRHLGRRPSTGQTHQQSPGQRQSNR
jgi:transposase